MQILGKSCLAKDSACNSRHNFLFFSEAKLDAFRITLLIENAQEMSSGKKRIVKDYDRLPEELIARIKLEYPFGFEDNLVSYKDAKGLKVSALPYDTEDVYYLVRMTKLEAQRIIEEDDDYDDAGNLRESFSADEIEADVSEEEEDSYDQPDEDPDEDEEDED